jgi:hypothetical protein
MAHWNDDRIPKADTTPANWNHPELTPSFPASFGNIPGQTVILLNDTRIVTRQQLRNLDFYQEVRAGLLDGSVVALDQRAGSIQVGTAVLRLTSPEGVKALADSQMGWVGVPDTNRFLGGLISDAQKINSINETTQQNSVGR